MIMMKKLMCLVLALVFVLLAVACSASTPQTVTSESEAQGQQENGAEASSEVTEINIWVSTGAEDEVHTTMLEAIDETLENVTINFQMFPYDELVSKLQVAPTVGDTPDIIMLDGLRAAYFQELGMLANIDSYVTDELRANMLQSVLDENTYNGELYGIAQFDAGMSFWGNKSMLEEAGVRIPTSYTEAWTRAEFEDALAKLKDSGIESPLYIRQNGPRTLYYTYMPIVRSFGGDYLDRETGLATGTLDSEETIEAVNYIGWLVEQGYVDPLVDYDDAFYGRQESALALIGHWSYTDTMESLGDDAILIPLPDMGEGVYTCSGSIVWNMTTAAVEAGKSDAAWEVLELIMSEEHVKNVTDYNSAGCKP